MSRNKKNRGSSFRIAGVIKVALLCTIVGAVGIGYINQKNAIALLGERMKLLETHHEKLLRDRQLLAKRLTILRSPPYLEAQVRRMGLGLTPVTPDRVVHMVLPSPDEMKDGKGRLYAEQNVRLSGWP